MQLLSPFVRCLALAALVVVFISCKSDRAEHSTANTPKEPPGDALFKLLSPEETGLQFSNEFEETEQVNIFTYGHLYNGGGVGAIDVNKDGLQDLFFSSTMGACKLFLNKGNLKFEDITQQAGVASPEGVKTGVSVADVNGDGWQDIYVCRSGPQTGDIRRNLLYINNQNNTFTESSQAYGLGDVSAHSMAAFIDYDKDGDLDLYLANTQVNFSQAYNMNVDDLGNGKYRRSGKPAEPLDAHRLFRNEGNKTFKDVTEAAGMYHSAFGLSISASDFNEDQYPDLYIGNDFIEPDFFYINDRNGKFTDKRDDLLRHLSNQSMGADIADINNDGLLDIFTADMLAEDYVLQQQRATPMKDERYYTLLSYGYGHQLMRNVLQLNNGNTPGSNLPSFSDVACLGGIFQTDWSWAPLMQDFDNDGWRDIYITTGYYRDVTNIDFVEFSMDTISQLTNGFNFYNMAVLNPILSRIPQFKLSHYAYRNKGASASGIAFDNVSWQWGLAEPSFANGAAYADLDNDGDLDLVVNNIRQNAFVYRNTASDRKSGHWIQLQLEGSGSNTQAIGAKVRAWAGDQIYTQEVYPVRGFFSSVPTLVHFGLGQTTIIDRLEVLFPDGRLIALQNVTADQRLSLAAKDGKPGKLTPLTVQKPLLKTVSDTRGLSFTHVEDDFRDFERERLLPWKLSTAGPCMATADVNGDGLQDVYIGGGANQPGVLLLQNSTGSFTPGSTATWVADQSFEDAGAVFFDADKDGDADLFVTSGGNAFPAGSPAYRPRLYTNDGKGNFSPAGTLPPLWECAAAVSAHDFDGDGDQDLFIGGYSVPNAYPTAPGSHVLLNDNGRFREVTREVAPDFEKIGMVRAMTWADLDGDRQAELLVAGEWIPLTVFKSSSGKLQVATEKFGLQQQSGFWRSLCCSDMDGDGDNDLVCGNLGLNSRYRASASEPLNIYARDFDKNGSIDPIMSFTQNGMERPIAFRHLMIRQMPALKKKFVRTQPYAEAGIYDVFPESEFEQAQKWTVNELATCYFENVNGRFERRELPIEAQIAPVQSILAFDINQDGFKDLIMAGNDFNQQVETGRIDAGNGLVLLGDGKGHFKTMPARHSGFWANLDVRSMCLLPTAQKKPLLLIGNSNGRLQAFECPASF